MDLNETKLHHGTDQKMNYGSNGKEEEKTESKFLPNGEESSVVVQEKKRWTAKRIFIGVIIIIGVVITWTGATQLTKSTLIDPAEYYAPYFGVYFSTCWMVICYPIFFLGFMLWKRIFGYEKTEAEMFRENKEVFGPQGATPLSVIRRTVPFTFFWIIANYSYAQSLGHIAAAETTAVFASNPAFVYLLSLVFLKENVFVIRVISIALSVVGIFLMAYAGGFGSFTIVGVIMAAIASLAAAVYKVFFRKVFGDATMGKVSLFMTSLGLCNLLLSWPIAVPLIVTGIETFRIVPWALMSGSAALALLFNLWLNVGVAVTDAIFISVGFFLGMPLNAVVDSIWRHLTLSPLEIEGSVCILISFILILIPGYLERKAFRKFFPVNHNTGAGT